MTAAQVLAAFRTLTAEQQRQFFAAVAADETMPATVRAIAAAA